MQTLAEPPSVEQSPIYEIEEIVYKSAQTLIQRATWHGQKVILKSLQNDYPTPEALETIHHEYEVLKYLMGDSRPPKGLPQLVALAGGANHPIIVMRDQQSVSLKNFLAGPINLKDFFKIALQLVSILEEIHQKQVIHKDVNPSNILIKSETLQVHLIDFGIASILPKEKQILSPPEQLEGTLAYMAPEQTGRMNRTLDYRADYYALGVTFYEMLIGQLPFQSDDPMELVHAHIAKIPPDPKQFNATIPETLSNIILKLMSKHAEDRYQSNQGLCFDLEKCLSDLDTPEPVPHFKLGEKDLSHHFQIKQKLYGRAKEIESLLQAFDRVSGSSPSKGVEFLLIEGFSGTGKSALVHEVHKPMTAKRGIFISGKYDQYQKNIPYSALSHALNEFCNYFLGKDPKILNRWKQIISEALGANGKVLVDLIPNLELLIGKQPEVSQVGSVESQNRLNLVFEQFIKAIAQKEHPLILFLDDLQWADSSSLHLLKRMVLNSEINHLLLIGAYRDNEITLGHPLKEIAAEIENKQGSLPTIHLENLTDADVNVLISETLSTPLQHTQLLTELIYEKTQGNAFFTIEFLTTLHSEGLLYWEEQWQWDIEQIRVKNISDNVVELMTGKIHKLKPLTQSLLQLAACIGNQFDLQTLAIVYRKEEKGKATPVKLYDLLQLLWPAIEEGLILPLDNHYKMLREGIKPQKERKAVPLSYQGAASRFKFVHDRVQQAAYSLIETRGHPKDQRAPIHLQIGRLLLANLSEEQLHENPFDVVNHWNHALSLLTSEEDKIQAAKLNQLAGIKAKQASAFESAINYLKTGATLLPKSFWQSHHPFMFNLNIKLAEAFYLNAHFGEANQLYSFLLQKSQSTQDQYKVYSVQLEQLLLEVKYIETIEIAGKALDLLGITVPKSEEEAEKLIGKELSLIPHYLAGRTPTDLLKEAKTPGEKERDQLSILSNLTVGAYRLSKTFLIHWICLKQIIICLQHGHNEMASYSYISYAFFLANYLNDYQTAYEYARIAIELAEHYGDPSYRCKTYHIYVLLINHWKKPLSKGFPYSKKTIQLCKDTGDLVFAGSAIFYLLAYESLCGKNLNDVWREAQTHIPFMKQKLKVYFEGMFKPALLQGLANLLGMTASPYTFNDPEDRLDRFDEQKYLQTIQPLNFLAYYHGFRVRSLYLFGQYEEALQHLGKLKFIAKAVESQAIIPETYFFLSLTLTAVFNEATKKEQRRYARILKKHQAKMKGWADHGPANYLHKYLLVEAERARLAGKTDTAMELYEQGIASAREYEYTNNEALGEELFARFWLEKNKEDYAQLHLSHAYALYKQWGAQAKVEEMERQWGSLPYSGLIAPVHPVPEGATVRPSSTTAMNLDINTIMKASQAISSEIHLEQLIQRMMRICLENAGAERGCLFLKMDYSTEGEPLDEEQLFLEAESHADGSFPSLQQSIPLEACQNIPLSVIRYVHHSRKKIVSENAAEDTQFGSDPYIVQHQSKSIMCVPILHQNQLKGILYLENNLSVGVFTPNRLEMVQFLSSQTAISMEIASLYANLEEKVEERTQELKQRQAQLIQSEKMAGLATMVAGAAHELNNPNNFIHMGSEILQTKLEQFKAYLFDLLNDDEEDMQSEFEKELAPIFELLMRILEGSQRIKTIVNGLRTFSRLGESEYKQVRMVECLQSTLAIVQANYQNQVNFICGFQVEPEIECWPAELNQTFMNIMNNACQAIITKQIETGSKNLGTLTITTFSEGESLGVRFHDTGCGMSQAVRSRMFEPFFTTRPVGQGTGLGLAIAFGTIEKHKGQIDVQSTVGEGTTITLSFPLVSSQLAQAS